MPVELGHVTVMSLLVMQLSAAEKTETSCSTDFVQFQLAGKPVGMRS
jgi:hypothetical protein